MRDVLARRAQHCVTHHAGCDCREYQRHQTEEALRIARAELEQIAALGHDRDHSLRARSCLRRIDQIVEREPRREMET